jgi:hypothetical protein
VTVPPGDPVSVRPTFQRGDPVNRSWLASLGIFVLVLVVLKFFFGWNISIIGSVVLTIILSVIFSLLNRR